MKKSTRIVYCIRNYRVDANLHTITERIKPSLPPLLKDGAGIARAAIDDKLKLNRNKHFIENPREFSYE
jgi:hypothetical protein